MLSHPDCRAFLTLIAAHHPAELEERNLPTLPFDRVLIELLACARLCKRFQIINGLKPELLEPALRGEHVGTIVRRDDSS